jgi:hypothetical protein
MSRFDLSPGRIEGRRGVELRKRRLRKHPLCAECKSRGLTTATEELDHVTPLAFGGTDTEDNIQGLCGPCHAAKSALEDAAHGGAANHPDWLKPSAIPLTILCGPPCSGKSTYIEQHAHPADMVIDLDGILQRLKPDYRHWSNMLAPDLLDAGIRARNAMLGTLSRQHSGQAWFIVSAPAPAERAWWHSKLGGELILLHPGADECKRRAVARGTPNAVAGVDDWERKAREPWATPSPRKAKAAIGLDGWPEG